MTDRLMLLDTASLYFRAFHGMPESMTAPDGTPNGALRGMLDIVTKLVSTYRPGSVVACWDAQWRPTWRVALLPSYKAHRVAGRNDDGTDAEDVPAALLLQIPLVREALELVGIPVVAADDSEADDVIGTLATLATGPVDVVTGDRDLFQLVDDERGVRVVYTARGMSNLEVVTGDVVTTKYGVRADQYADFATLRGDPSDGLPGVAGVGDKTAAALLDSHGDLSRIRAAAASGEGMTPRIAGKIIEAADYLDAAPRVVAVARDLDLTLPGAELRALSDDDAASARDFARRHGAEASLDRLLAALPEE